MRRHLPTAFAGLSLLLCLGTVALWYASRQELVSIRSLEPAWREYRRGWGVWGSSNGLTLARSRPGPRDVRVPWSEDDRTASDAWYARLEAEAHNRELRFAGFEVWYNTPITLVNAATGTDTLRGYQHKLTVPYWFLLALTGTPPAWRLLTLKSRVRRRRRERGLCARCGYDLRGSKDSGRCPECGTGFAKRVAALIRSLLARRPGGDLSAAPIWHAGAIRTVRTGGPLAPRPRSGGAARRWELTVP